MSILNVPSSLPHPHSNIHQWHTHHAPHFSQLRRWQHPPHQEDDPGWDVHTLYLSSHRCFSMPDVEDLVVPHTSHPVSILTLTFSQEGTRRVAKNID